MKKNIDNYIIKLNTRNNIPQKYLFEFENEFFKNFKDSEITEANIKADITLTSQNEKFTLNVKLSGEIYNLICDLCADSISVNIESSSEITIIETTSNLESTDEIIYINTQTKQLCIKQLLFELISISIPNKRQHNVNKNGESDCDKEMINLIKEYTEIRNTPNEEQWDILKDLKIT